LKKTRTQPRSDGRSERGVVQGLSLVAFTVLVVVAFLALELGWRPSGAGSAALEAINRVRKATAAHLAERTTPLPDVADGSLAVLEQHERLGPLSGGRLPIEGGGAVTRVRWIGVRHRQIAFVAVTVELASREALEDLFSRARRQRAFVQQPVRGLDCDRAPPVRSTLRATLCYEL
jgi:hypothetical protein